MLVTKVVVLATWLKSAPCDFRAAARFAKTCSVCSLIPGPTTFPPASTPTCPAMNRIFPDFTTCVYVPGCGVESPRGLLFSSVWAAAATDASESSDATVRMLVMSGLLPQVRGRRVQRDVADLPVSPVAHARQTFHRFKPPAEAGHYVRQKRRT